MNRLDGVYNKADLVRARAACGRFIQRRPDTLGRYALGASGGRAFSKHCPPENYVIGTLSDSLEHMAGWVLRWLSAVRTRLPLTSCWNLLSCAISSRCCNEQAHGVDASARVSGRSGRSCRAGGQIGGAV
jgi:hypothetical protein